MALTDVLIPNSSADVVAVFDADFNQVFSTARPIKAMVNEESKVMMHPLEDGATIADHQVFLGTTIELSMMLSKYDYRSVYQQIKQIYRASTILTVQTRTDSYTNMIIQKMPHDEDPELFDVIALAVRLEEAQFITPQYGSLPPSKVANAGDSSTVNKGSQQTSETTDPAPSILYGIFKG